MESRMFKIYARSDEKIQLKVYPGHFVTSQSHITHYLDMTTMKSRSSEAKRIAQTLAKNYEASTPVDTIVCLDGLQVVGAYLSEELTKAGVLSMNAHQTMYITSPEYDSIGQMIFRDNNKMMIEGKNVLILIASVVLGAITGTLLNIDGRISSLAEKVEARFRKKDAEVSVAEGIITATLLFCVGSMTVTGSIQAGLTGDNSLLITKAMLDLVSSMILASSLGVGVLLSAAAVLVIQGGLVLLAGLLAPVMSAGAINEMTCAGSLLIIMIGTNLMGMTKIKVADFLPAIFFAPVIFNLIPLFQQLWALVAG